MSTPAAPTPPPSYRLGLVPGDGIVPEIVPAAVRVVDAALAAIGTHGSAIPPATPEALAGLDG